MCKNINKSIDKEKSRNTDIPKYKATQLETKKNKYCICIPIINEGERINKELERAKNSNIQNQADIILIDSGTTDGSTEIANLKKYEVNTLIEMEEKKKYTQSKALRAGFYFATQRGYEGIITIDGNNKDSIEDIPRFIEKLEQGFDFIQGSRYIEGGTAINTPKIRDFAIRHIHAPVISSICKKKYTDTTSLFRGYSRKYLLHDDVQPFRKIFQSYELSTYLSTRADVLGLKTCEIPVTRAYPASKKYSTKVGRIKGNYLLIKSLIEDKLGKYDC